MKIKKPILLICFMSISLAAFAMATAPDCRQLLTIDVNAALEEYFADEDYCDGVIVMGDACLKEAGLSYNASINAALAAYDKCCCSNGQTCCDP